MDFFVKHFRGRGSTVWSAIAGLGAVLALSACHKGGPDAAKGPPGGGAMPVSVVQVKSERVPALIEAVGQTEGSREVEIRARISGILQKRLYQEGDAVAAGAVLFRIDREPYEIALDQTKAALALEQSRRDQAEREALRMKQLAAEKAVSQKEYDDAASAFQQARASVLAAETKVREAELNLSYVTVVAPIRGITGRAQRSEGTLVTAGTDSALLTTLVQTDPIWVRFSFSESEYMELRSAGRKADIKLILPDGTSFNGGGHINFTASNVDTKLGTVQLRAEFSNPRLMLLPGQFVRVQVLTGEQQAFLVPQPAVQQSDQGRSVWVVGADGKAAPRPVEASAWSNGNWVVRKGLADGDQVIVDNIMKLRPGVPVQPHLTGAGTNGAPAGAQAPASANAAGKAASEPSPK